MRLRLTLFATFLALPAMAQTPTVPAPDPQSLNVARQLVAKVAGDRDQVLGALARPLVGFMEQMGMKDPVKSQTLVDEALMPLLHDHYDELLSMRAELYAKELSLADLQATLVFFNTPAGQDWVRVQPALAQQTMGTITQWLGRMQPEIQARVKQVMQQHGWAPT